MTLFATKPIATLRAEAEATGEHALTRALGPLNLVTLGIGAVIGAGIFVITGQVAALYAGPAVPLSMIRVRVAAAFAGLCDADMASAVPVAGLVFFSYIGFDTVSTAAQESKNPQRDMPIGILGSLVICTLLYVVVSAVLVGMVPYGELNLPAPMAYAMERIGAPWWIRLAINLGAVLGVGSVILVMLLGQSRVFYSMSRDGLLGPWAGRVHPRFRTPYVSTIYTGIAVCFATGPFPLQLLRTWGNIGTLLAFVLVCAGVWILRYTRPDLERPFRAPLVPLVPLAGILSCLGLMLTLPLDTWVRLFVWLAFGLAVYFGYGRRHSVLGK